MPGRRLLGIWVAPRFLEAPHGMLLEDLLARRPELAARPRPTQKPPEAGAVSRAVPQIVGPVPRRSAPESAARGPSVGTAADRRPIVHAHPCDATSYIGGGLTNAGLNDSEPALQRTPDVSPQGEPLSM
jgi:hypothetical protein